MKNCLITGLTALLVSLLLSSCAMLSNRQEPAFTPVDLNAKFQSGEFQKKVDNFLLIFDASSSMFLNHNNEMKFKQARRVANRLNQTLPTLDMNAGLRIFGAIDLKSDSKLSYGMTPYSQNAFADALQSVTVPDGGTPLPKSFNVATNDLTNSSGKIALIVISDGEDLGESSITAAKALKDTYKDRICIYTIHIGNNIHGKNLFEQITETSQCGFATNYSTIESPQGMADFIERVFLEKSRLDSDGDGVLDRADQCPDTPKGTRVDSSGCPVKAVDVDSDSDGVLDSADQCPNTPKGITVDRLGCPVKAVNMDVDSDGDGVYDSKDQCPKTPRGIKVDSLGCPLPIMGSVTIELRVEFDFDKDLVRPQYHQELQNFANFMATHPELTVTLEGHTDNYGDDDYNKRLSLRRAKSVRRYLVDNFDIWGNSITTKGYGYSRPEVANDTDEGRQKNRRVYATITSK